jgi:hypothetical protein
MRLYVAASFPRKRDAEALAAKLIAAGHTVTSTWHVGPGGDYASRGGPATAACQDMADVLRAEALVCITGDTLTHGGRHGEVGAALATRRPVYLLGPREECVWHHHPRVHQYDTVKALLAHLRGVDILMGRTHE